MDYLKRYKKMISLRGLTDHTMKSYQTYISAYLDYIENILHKPWDDTQLPMRKFDTYLPFVPTKEETKTFISTMTDIKPKAMVALMYSSGLRIGEVCNLRYEDIQRKNMRIHITHGKNRSDRYAILSRQALDILTEYWFACGGPTGYLFPKQRHHSVPVEENPVIPAVRSPSATRSLSDVSLCMCFQQDSRKSAITAFLTIA